MTDWITDRQPTEADGDSDGDVYVRFRPNMQIAQLLHWSYVGTGVPWKHRAQGQRPAPVAKPAPAVPQPRRFVSISRQIAIAGSVLDAVADDGTAWSLWPGDNQWQPHSPLPPREVPADV